MSFLCAALLTFSGFAAADAAPRRLGQVVIPDLRALLAHVEETAATVAPGTLPPGTLGVMLGAQLGDPGLAGLGRGPLVLTVQSGASPVARPSVALFLPVSNPEPYEHALKKMGWTATRAPGLVMAGATGAPVPSADDYRRIAAQPFAGDLRLSLNVVDLTALYGPLMRSSFEAMTSGLAKAPPSAEGAPSTRAVARMLQLEMRVLLMLLEQTESIVADLTLQPDAVLSETVISARPATALATLTSHPPAAPNAAASFLSSPAVMVASYQLDAPRVASFVADLISRSAGDPATAAVATPELQAVVEEWGRAYTGEMALAMRTSAEAPLGMESVQKVRNEAAALALLEKAAALAAPGGPWHAFYVEMGMPMRMSLRKDVRRHAGVPVHRFEMKLDARTLPAEQQASMALFMRDMELAFSRGYLLVAQEPQALDRLLDRVAAGKPAPAPLQAARAFGEGAHLYVDYDFFGLMRAMSTVLPKGAAANPFADLPDTSAQPLLYAARLADERLTVETKLPLQPIADLVKAFKKTNTDKKVAEGASPLR
jgi:hypothetical protein